MPLTGEPSNPLSDLLNTQAEFPQLTEHERQQLREMCVPGAPLWKILKAGVDHARAMRDDIAMIPLVGETNIQSARQLQVQMDAAYNFTKWVAQVIQFTPSKDQTNAPG